MGDDELNDVSCCECVLVFTAADSSAATRTCSSATLTMTGGRVSSEGTGLGTGLAWGRASRSGRSFRGFKYSSSDCPDSSDVTSINEDRICGSSVPPTLRMFRCL